MASFIANLLALGYIYQSVRGGLYFMQFSLGSFLGPLMLALVLFFGGGFLSPYHAGAVPQFSKAMEMDSRDTVDAVTYHNGRLYLPESVWLDQHNRVNKLHVLDAASRTLLGTVSLDNLPGELLADGNRLLVGSVAESFLNVFNLRSMMAGPRIIPLGPELLSPNALAIGDGVLYVSDVGNRQILKLSALNFKKKGSYFSGSGPFKMVVANGKLFILSALNIFDPKFNIIRVLAADNGMELRVFDHEIGDLIPRGYNSVFKHSDGNIYATAPFVYSLADPGKELPVSALVSFRPDLSLSAKVTLIPAWFPQAMASIGKYLVVLDRGSLDSVMPPALLLIDPEAANDQMLLGRIDLKELSHGQIIEPRAIASSPSGEVFIDSVGLLSVVGGLTSQN